MIAFNWPAVLPELLLFIMSCAIALVDLGVKTRHRSVTYALSLVTLALVAGMHLAYFHNGRSELAFGGLYVGDPLGHLLSFFATVAVAVTLIYSRSYASERDILKGELFTLSLLALLGVSIMVSANHLLVIYLGLELMSLSLYALVALRRDDVMATEAGMKYFVLGALASGFLLYGMSMLYGATGSLDLGDIFAAIGSGAINKQVLVFGLVFVVAGLAFKLGAVPFHMWVPDVYHGAPTAATLMVAAAPKLAAFGVVMRLLVEGLIGLAVDWQQMLTVLAVASLLVGNLAAIAQTNLKRMLAYSTIAQIGFMLLGLTVGVVNGNTVSAANAYTSSLFYLVTYVLTTLGTFGLIMVLARRGFEADELKDLAGLNQRSPLLAGVMAIFMFSLAGIPPTVGFYGKLAVLQSLISTNQAFNIGLAVVAVLLSLVGAYYYLRVVKLMYFDEAVDLARVSEDRPARALLAVNGAAVLVFGLLPSGLMAMCARAIVLALGS